MSDISAANYGTEFVELLLAILLSGKRGAFCSEQT